MKLFSQGTLILILTIACCSLARAWDCVYVSSYHQGYAWSDGVEKGLRAELEGKCDLTQFDMDSKRNRAEHYKIKKAREIALEIRKIKPDVIITSDDNAAKYLIVPYLKGEGKTPVVFCGINWTVKEYGFPASNVTGMIEVAPVKPMLQWAHRLTGSGSKGVYIGANTLTEQKDYKYSAKAAAGLNIVIEPLLVDSQEEWMSAFKQTKEADFVILGSSIGIKGWDDEALLPFVREHADKLILTNYSWMLPLAMLGFVKSPEEQGEWAAKAAVAIYEGFPIQRIPIIANRKWEVYENTSLLKLSGIKISDSLRARAKKYRQGL